jgi:hypothetical protein
VPSDHTDDQFRGRATHKKEHAYFFEASAYGDDPICMSERTYEENVSLRHQSMGTIRFVDHKSGGSAVKADDGYIVSANGNKTRRLSQVTTWRIDGSEDPAKTRWAMFSEKYVKQAVREVETELHRIGSKAVTPLTSGYRPEMDVTPELDAASCDGCAN